jgi:methyl-accepting chemotaxis protein
VQGLVGELNTLAEQIGQMAGEQGERRKAAEESLGTLLEYTGQITGLVGEANESVQGIGDQMQGVVKRGDEMGQMTSLQGQRSKAISKLSQESGQAAKDTVVGAGGVVDIMTDMQAKSADLNEQVQQFKI